MIGEKSVRVVFSLGSDCGDREASVAKGISWLRNILGGCRVSSIYATPDCHGGFKEYMNAVVSGYTDLSASRLEAMCKEFEVECGRTPECRAKGDVPIDVDIVIYDGKILRERDYAQEFFRIGMREIQI